MTIVLTLHGKIVRYRGKKNAKVGGYDMLNYEMLRYVNPQS